MYLYDIRNISQKWIRSYLSPIKQFVEYKDVKSGLRYIVYGKISSVNNGASFLFHILMIFLKYILKQICATPSTMYTFKLILTMLVCVLNDRWRSYEASFFYVNTKSNSR